MARKKLTVRRKPYSRGPYTRKGGVHVSGADVLGSTFKVKDRGKPGRTPKAQRFYDPQVHMGWHKGDSLRGRRVKALRAHDGDLLATARALQALANVTTDGATKRAARADAKYFFARHKKGR